MLALYKAPSGGSWPGIVSKLWTCFGHRGLTCKPYDTSMCQCQLSTRSYHDLPIFNLQSSAIYLVSFMRVIYAHSPQFDHSSDVRQCPRAPPCTSHHKAQGQLIQGRFHEQSLVSSQHSQIYPSYDLDYHDSECQDHQLYRLRIRASRSSTV